MPGQDYALTEVVHCGTQHEAGIADAFATCSSRYFNRTIAASPAQVVICVGAWATEAFRLNLEIDMAKDRLWGPAELLGRVRYVLSVPHPGAFGRPKSLEPSVGADGLSRLREAFSDAASPD